ncbi:MAG: hypothetical protein LAT50_03370 [Ectothiorhodospiraceae bacterium]|nr:hypothetical protein [Ectothiorhodospiraceae bacterium]
MKQFTVAPPRELDRALPRELAGWLAALPRQEKGAGFRALPLHRGAVAFLESTAYAKADLLAALDTESLRSLCHLVSLDVLRETLPDCAPETAERVFSVLRSARHSNPEEVAGRSRAAADLEHVPLVPWSFGRLLRDLGAGRRQA